jgi:hypothetical protein
MTDEELGTEFLRAPWNDPKMYESDSPRDAMEQANRVQVGALVRLVREILDSAAVRGADAENKHELENADPGIRNAAQRSIAWLAEARALVGKEDKGGEP